jgi:hypothetical protein
MRVAIVLLLVAAACGGGSEQAGDEGLTQADCDQAWAEVPRASPIADYRTTFTRCSGLLAWNAGNRGSGHNPDAGSEAISEHCRALALTTAVCAEAARTVPDPSDPGGEPAEIDTVTCADYFRDKRNVGDKLKLTNAVLRRMNPANATPSLTVQLEYGRDVEAGCDPTGTGVGSQGIHVADIGERVYIANPARYGG